MKNSKICNKKIEYIINVVLCFTFAMYIGVKTLVCTLLELNSEVLASFWTTIRYACYLIFLAQIIYDAIKGEKISLLAVIMFVISILIYLYTRNSRLMLLIFILIAIRKCNIKELIEIGFLTQAVIYIVTICLALLNVIPDWTYTRGEILRHSLGFTYSTITIGFFSMLTIMYCYIRRSKVSYIELIVLQIINIILYMYTDGRLGFTLVTATLLLMALYKMFKSKKQAIKKFLNNNIIKTICCALPIILLVLMMLLSYLYSIGNNVAIYVNELLSDRLRLNYEAFERYKIGLFGNRIKWNRMGWIWIYISKSRKL